MGAPTFDVRAPGFPYEPAGSRAGTRPRLSARDLDSTKTRNFVSDFDDGAGLLLPIHTGRTEVQHAIKAQTGDSGLSASLSVIIGYVTFGQRLRRLDPVAGGHVVRLRLDVVAAGGTYDPDLRIDVDGARLLSCSLHELAPGRVAHVVLRVWIPARVEGRSIRVTATVRLRTDARGDARVFRETYEVPIPIRKS